MKELYRHKHPRLMTRDLMRALWTTKHKFKQMELAGQEKSKARKLERERPYL